MLPGGFDDSAPVSTNGQRYSTALAGGYSAALAMRQSRPLGARLNALYLNAIALFSGHQRHTGPARVRNTVW